jgi:hypothetical protein
MFVSGATFVQPDGDSAFVQVMVDPSMEDRAITRQQVTPDQELSCRDSAGGQSCHEALGNPARLFPSRRHWRSTGPITCGLRRAGVKEGPRPIDAASYWVFLITSDSVQVVA